MVEKVFSSEFSERDFYLNWVIPLPLFLGERVEPVFYLFISEEEYYETQKILKKVFRKNKKKRAQKSRAPFKKSNDEIIYEYKVQCVGCKRIFVIRFTEGKPKNLVEKQFSDYKCSDCSSIEPGPSFYGPGKEPRGFYIIRPRGKINKAAYSRAAETKTKRKAEKIDIEDLFRKAGIL